MKVKLVFAVFVLCILASGRILSQSLSESIVTKIDKLFAKWDNKTSPGCAVGIVRNDSLIFAKGYGMANLEYSIANTPKTLFHVASVSKQFTAYSILMLAKAGRLGLDDDIRKYLSWFPDLKKKITIRNLLNHTSGIRDQWQLLAIAGTRLDDVITQEHIVKILSKQKDLNFTPGEKYMYSNSGFTLLAEIVRSVSGKSLRKFSDSTIFKPLGMSDTHFHDDYSEVEKNRSYSYYRVKGDQFANSILSYSNAGATSLFTTVEDLAKWVMNFYNTKAGDQNDIKLLTQRSKLNDGFEIEYALGIVNNIYKGWTQYSHSGGDAGYVCNVSIFPELKMGFIILANIGETAPWNKTAELQNIFIEEKTKHTESPIQAKKDSSAANIKDSQSVMNYGGSYINETGALVKIDIKKEKAFYHIYQNRDLLVNESKDRYSLLNAPYIKYEFSINGKDTNLVIHAPNGKSLYTKYNLSVPETDKELEEYTGVYNCPELDCNYTIMLKDHKLYLTNSKYEDAHLVLRGADHLFNSNWWMKHIVIRRDDSKKIIGFEVNSDRIMHLNFNKIK